MLAFQNSLLVKVRLLWCTIADWELGTCLLQLVLYMHSITTTRGPADHRNVDSSLSYTKPFAMHRFHLVSYKVQNKKNG